MKLLAVAMIIGFCLLAVIPGGPITSHPQERKTCCMPDSNANQGRITCHMDSQGGNHACNCRSGSAFPPASNIPAKCNGACGTLMTLTMQPSQFLDRIRRFAFGGYRRITKGNLLEHESRRQIYDMITAYPGIDLKKLIDLTEINENTLRYHLERLHDGSKITTIIVGGVSHYFENHGKYSREEQIIIARMLTTTSSRMLMIILDHPGLTRGDLALQLGVAGPTVTRSVQSLIDENLIQVKREGRFTRYFPNNTITGETSRNIQYPSASDLADHKELSDTLRLQHKKAEYIPA